jgi:hypothetical protein
VEDELGVRLSTIATVELEVRLKETTAELETVVSLVQLPNFGIAAAATICFTFTAPSYRSR